jgi:hypothetical protein
MAEYATEDPGDGSPAPDRSFWFLHHFLGYMRVAHIEEDVVMTNLDVKLKIDSWDEQPTMECPDGTKLSRTDVRLSGGGDVSAARAQSLLFYRADGTSAFVGLMRVEATMEGRSGAFALYGTGGYDGTTATQDLRIVEGSGSDGLESISGSATSASTHEDYPFMPLRFDYRLR